MTDRIEVATSRGVLTGERAPSLCVFRGVRYASPPVGPRRFRPPTPPPSWEGVRPALEFGPACPQGTPGAAGDGGRPRAPVFGGLFGPGDHGVSEDCLFLNIWTPGVDRARRPVLVFVHGGAFRLGAGSAPTYDGSRLAVRGDVVVVTLNYRLGPLGFLHAPDLGAVNLGLQDQVAALRWVSEEIAAFGGDPEAVTVFGESAGAKSIECLLAVPSARGLFRSAILQSPYALAMDPAAGAEFTAVVARTAGVDLEGLRHLPLDALLAATAAAQGGPGSVLSGGAIGPVVDGEVLPDHPVDLMAAGSVPAIPLVVGTNRDEARLFGAATVGDLDRQALLQRLGQLLGPDSPVAPDAVAAAYEGARAARGLTSSPADLFFSVQTDRMFRLHSMALAEAHRHHCPDVWMYLLTWPAAPPLGAALGACHALELPFVFGTLDGPTSHLTGQGPEAEALSDWVQDAWLSFARTGAMPAAWPRYEPARRPTQDLGATVATIEAPGEEERRFWAAH